MPSNLKSQLNCSLNFKDKEDSKLFNNELLNLQKPIVKAAAIYLSILMLIAVIF
jgi:hypothetical protein